MTPLTLAWRGLAHQRLVAAGTVLALAVAGAVITAALVLGDSLQGTLRARLDARLGPVDQALVAAWPLAPAAGARLVAGDPAHRAAVRLLGAGVRAAAGGPALPATVTAVDDGFRRLFPDLPALGPRAAALSPALAVALGVAAGDDLLLGVGTPGELPAGSAFAERRRERLRQQLRVTVAAVLPAAGAGAFTLDPGVDAERTLYLDRAWLAGVLGGDAVDAVLVVGAADLGPALAASPADLGLRLIAGEGQITVQGRGLVLPAAVAAGVRRAAAACGASAAATVVHLADRVRAEGREASYAVVAGLEPPSPLDCDAQGVLLSEWLAEDLGARVGSRVALDLPLPPAGEGPRFARLDLEVRALVPATGAAVDAALVPVVAGFSDAARITGWDLPYPVDPARVSARDDAWWEAHRTAPKLFVAPAQLERLWAGSAGSVAGLRVVPPPGMTVAALEPRLAAALVAAITPAEAGLALQPLREQAHARAAGNADLVGLFLGLGGVVVAAGLALAVWLVRLQLARRRAELGLLLACGWSPGRVRALLAAEGALLSVAGGVGGALLGVALAQGLIAVLAAGWARAAVGLPLTLHLLPSSLAAGAIAGALAGLAATLWAGWGALRATPAALLAGWRAVLAPPRAGSPGLVLALLGGAGAAAFAGRQGWLPAEAAAPLAGLGALVAGVLGGLWLARHLRARGVRGLALAEAARPGGRAALALGLTAVAGFILLLVAAQRRPPADPADPAGPGGGFALRLTTALPLPEDLARAGVGVDEQRQLASLTVEALWVGPGDDISCANPARPQQPRLYGVEGRVLGVRGGFGLDAAAWRALAADAGPIPVIGDADSLRWSLRSAPGAELAGPAGTRLRVQAALPASVLDAGLVMDAAAFRRCFPTVAGPRQFLIALPTGADPAAVAALLRRRLADVGAEVRPVPELLAARLAQRDAYLGLFLALGGLGLVLGTAGLGLVLARDALERRRELALLAALGRDPRRIQVGGHALLLGAGLAVALLAAAAAALVAPPPAAAWLAVLPWLAAVLGCGLAAALLAVRWSLGRSLAQELRGD